MTIPKIVQQAEWELSHASLQEAEKQATKARDALAAARRRQAMVEVGKSYMFNAPDGDCSLLDLFDVRSQLIIYHHMLKPNDQAPCSGCSMVADGIGNLAHLHRRDVSLAFVSTAPQNEIAAFKQRMSWSMPWYTTHDAFNADFGVTDGFGLNIFLRHGEKIYRTYFTSGRGVETLGSTWSFLDLTPFGRQEDWEDSPQGWPQEKPYQWWRLHDEY